MRIGATAAAEAKRGKKCGAGMSQQVAGFVHRSGNGNGKDFSLLATPNTPVGNVMSRDSSHFGCRAPGVAA